MSLFKRKNKKQDEPYVAVVNEPARPKAIYCKVVGTTFDNADGVNRQDILKAIRDELVGNADPTELYGGYSNKELIDEGMSHAFETLYMDFPVTIQHYEYDGSPALAVVYNNKVIGNLPKEQVQYFLDNSQYNGYSAKCEITGGKTKRVEWDDEKEKDIVTTDTLTYGAEIIIDFK